MIPSFVATGAPLIKRLASRFRDLIIEPLQELEKALGIGNRILVFVDGLDECESPEAQCEIIEIVAAARGGVASLSWAFFSDFSPLSVCFEQ